MVSLPSLSKNSFLKKKFVQFSQNYATFLIIQISKNYQELKDFSSLQNG
jgi:hypothetical protein